MDFKAELKKYQSYVDEKLDEYFKEENSYEKRLRESMRYSLLAGGKRVRPILMLATYRLFREDYERCLPFALGMEMVHNASLIHDDMPCIDNDDFRHGKPTNHKMYDECTALLAGDALFNYSNIVITDDLRADLDIKSISMKIMALNEFVKAKDRMICGEYFDTVSEGQILTLEQLEYMHRNKTGALIKESVRIGALLGGATNQELLVLTNFAEDIGLAFQIKDDILSEIGDSKKTGKPVGNDRELNKATYVTKYGLERAQEMLDDVINDAMHSIRVFGDKSEFLLNLALYIKDRER
ncbi:MAG: polyprenyl synthetase family protein [Clostridia bacterium]|nr:polyprenyl synthetase family protein [Clostridia bacterium]